MPAPVIQNFYEHVPSENSSLRSYPNEKYLNIKLPFRMLLCGPSGSGKTNVVMNLLKLIGIFDNIILLAKDLEEPLYKHLIATYRRVEKKHKIQVLLAIDTIKDMPEINDCDPKKNTLFICDDLICENKKDLALVEAFWIRARKRGVSMIFLSQGYYCVPKLIRQNSNYIVIKKLDTIKDLKALLREYSLGIDIKELMILYNKAMDMHSSHTAFFMIDTAGPKELRFRSQFSSLS